MLAPAIMLQQLLFLTVLAVIAKSNLSAESGTSLAQHRTYVVTKSINLDGKYLHSAFRFSDYLFWMIKSSSSGL